MWLETNRLIIRSIQRGDEIIFSGMSQDGSLSQVGFDANCSEWINDWIEEALKLTNNDNPKLYTLHCYTKRNRRGHRLCWFYIL